MIVATVLRTGGEYKPEHVKRLYDQLRGTGSKASLWCLTNEPHLVEEWATTIPLENDWPGWWSKIELFRPIWDEHVVYLDLDTTILKDPVLLKRDNFTMLENFYYKGSGGSGVMSWGPTQTPTHIYHEYLKNPTRAERSGSKVGDQGFIMDHYPNPAFYEDPLVISYKAHYIKTGKVPQESVVMAFHGKPRPWDVKL